MVPAHLLCLVLLPPAHGHGNLVRPFAWWDTQKIGWWWDADGEHSDVGCGNLDLPPTEYLASGDSTDFFGPDTLPDNVPRNIFKNLPANLSSQCFEELASK